MELITRTTAISACMIDGQLATAKTPGVGEKQVIAFHNR